MVKYSVYCLLMGPSCLGSHATGSRCPPPAAATARPTAATWEAPLAAATGLTGTGACPRHCHWAPLLLHGMRGCTGAAAGVMAERALPAVRLDAGGRCDGSSSCLLVSLQQRTDAQRLLESITASIKQIQQLQAAQKVHCTRTC